MSLFNPWAVLCAGLVSAPAWWSALVDGQLPVATAATRFLLALVVFACGVGAIGTLVEGYRAGSREPATPRRRAGDQPEQPEPPA